MEKKILNMLIVVLVAFTVIFECLGAMKNSDWLGWLGIILAFAAVILAVNVQKAKYRKAVTAVLAFCMIFLPVMWYWGGDILGVFTPDPVVYELTEEEKEWLKACAGNKYDEERIEEGNLLRSQYAMLEKGRTGLEYLEEKYPGYEFKITYMESMVNLKTFSVREKTTDYRFSMYISKNEDGTLEIKDNFYAYLFEDKYEAYVEEQIKEKIENVVKVNLYISSVEGREYDSSMTVDDIVSGKLEVHATIHINIAAKGMTEEECMENVKLVEQSIKEVGVSGIYDIFYRDMTEEEILSTDEYEKAIYAPIIHFFNGEVEIY